MIQDKFTRLSDLHATSPQGKQLLGMILDICQDEEFDLAEIKELYRFLTNDKSGIPAVKQLRPLVADVIADEDVDQAEAYRLKQAFLKVCPPDVRRVVETHLDSIDLPTTEASNDDFEPAWKHHPATRKQIEFIRNLGGYVPPDATKGEASLAIDALLNDRPATPRQLMLLRFFDRLELAASSKDEVGEWVDDFYASDERYLRAWERFKRATNHNPRGQDPNVVPVGAYRQYMESDGGMVHVLRVQDTFLGRRGKEERLGCRAVLLIGLVCVGLVLTAVMLIWILVQMLFKSHPPSA